MEFIKRNQYIILGVILVLIVVIVINNLIYKARQRSADISSMKSSLKGITTNIISFNEKNAKYTGNLRDYYIMTSYNSCCVGRFKDSYVDLDALKMVMSLGARCLDFEIYTLNGEPVVAVSPNDDYHMKTSYNYIPFGNVMNFIATNGFSSVPNPNDPLLLHFRLKTNIGEICDKMATTIKNQVSSARLLDVKYGYTANGNNLGAEPVANFQGKMIIMISRENTIWEGTKLAELTNIATNSNFVRLYRNYDIQYGHNPDELIEFNKKNMTIGLPDLNDDVVNITPSIHMSYGVQMVAMSFQPDGNTLDNKLENYIKFFNKERAAFVLKPEKLRYKPATIPIPDAQKPEVSYSQKVVEAPFFKHVL
jgi:hypothetical protein